MTGLERRIFFCALGCATGAAFFGLSEGLDHAWLPDRVILILEWFLALFCGVVLLSSAQIGLRLAARYGVILAAFSCAMVAMTALRWPMAEGFFASPWPSLAALILGFLPLPFVISYHRSGDPLDYDQIFTHSYQGCVQIGLGVLFTLALWLMIWLADTLLEGLGLSLIADVTTYGAIPYMITGGALGLALAVAQEFRPTAGASLGLWLMQLLLPVLVVFSALFSLTALGTGLDEAYVPGFVLLVMAGAGVVLISLVVGRHEDQQREGFVFHTAKAMSVLGVAMAVVSLMALRLRVQDYGWSPNRIALGLAAVLVLLTALGYVSGLMRPKVWAQRVRRVNLLLAGLVYLCAVLWLSPLFNAQKISAQSQISYFDQGGGRWFSAATFADLGYAGLAAQETILAQAKAKGNQGLVDLIEKGAAGPTAPDPEVLAAMLDDLRQMLVVSPSSATGTRDSFLMLMQPNEIEEIVNACAILSPEGRRGCVMVVGDLLPYAIGEEAILLLDRGGWVSIEGLFLQEGRVERRVMRSHDGSLPRAEEARDLITLWQDSPPPVAPLGVNQLGSGAQGLFFLP